METTLFLLVQHVALLSGIGVLLTVLRARPGHEESGHGRPPEVFDGTPPARGSRSSRHGRVAG